MPERKIVPGPVPPLDWSNSRPIENWFDSLLGSSLLRRISLADTDWVPSMEMYEKDDKFVIRAELPGLKEDEVEVSLSGDLLTVKGEKKTLPGINKNDYQFSEMRYGSFCRYVKLPFEVDRDNIDATFEDGILCIHLPKLPESSQRKIPIYTPTKLSNSGK